MKLAKLLQKVMEWSESSDVILGLVVSDWSHFIDRVMLKPTVRS